MIYLNLNFPEARLSSPRANLSPVCVVSIWIPGPAFKAVIDSGRCKQGSGRHWSEVRGRPLVPDYGLCGEDWTIHVHSEFIIHDHVSEAVGIHYVPASQTGRRPCQLEAS